MMIDGVKNEFFGKYAQFNGRTDRRTFWLTVLGVFILVFVVSFIIGLIGSAAGDSSALSTIMKFLLWILELCIIVPSIALSVRRLHDINKSGWWYLISLVPFVGSIVLIVFYCLPSENQGNNY